MKKLLSIALIALPIFSGDAQKIIKKIEAHQPHPNDDSYTLLQETPRAKIDAWHAALKEAEQFIKKNNPAIIPAFNEIRDKSNTVINAMKTVYNHTMSNTDVTVADFDNAKSFKDQAKKETAAKILSPVQKFEQESLKYHMQFPQLIEELKNRKRGFFDTKKKNEDKAELVLAHIKDVVAQQIISILKSFQMIKVNQKN